MPGHERLVAKQVLELARMAADPLAPDLEGQRRIVGIGALLGVAEARDGRSTPAGQQVDLAHLGGVAVADLGARVVGREPGRAAGPRRGVGAAAPSAGPKPSTTAVFAGQLRRPAPPAGTGRSASG